MNPILNDSNIQLSNLTHFDITKEDIVTIALAKREQELTLEFETLTQTLENARSSLQTATKELDDAIENHIEVVIKPEFTNLVEIMKKHGFKIKEPQFTGNINNGSLNVSVTLYSDHGRLTSNLTKRLSTPIKNCNTKVANHTDEINLLEKELLKIKRELSKLPSLERQARAQIVLNLLHTSNTEQSKALLDILNSTKDDLKKKSLTIK